HDLRTLFDQVMPQERHQEIQLLLRPLPVLHAQAVEGQLANAEPATLFDGGPDTRYPAAVSFDARQPTLLGPTAIPIHDDCDMAGQPRWIETGRGQTLQRAGIEGGSFNQEAFLRREKQQIGPLPLAILVP